MKEEKINELLFRLADDQLIIGHRNSEWTGMGPLLEEDIAFSSMAQDKIGHSLAIYQLLEANGCGTPDQLAFLREREEYKNSILTELPNTDFAFSLTRQFLFDTAEALRMKDLESSSYAPLAALAKKIKGELMYHVIHGNTWLKKLGNGTEDSIQRMQAAFDQLIPYALGMFESFDDESDLISQGVYSGESKLLDTWKAIVEEKVGETEIRLNKWDSYSVENGGRHGKHTEHLQQLIDEMSEVIKIDPNAEW